MQFCTSIRSSLSGTLLPRLQETRSDSLHRSMLVQNCIDNGFNGLDLSYCPLILFPLLHSNDGWSNKKPSEKYRQSYRELMGSAIAVLNTAGVPHLDMRPPNIMWQGLDLVNEKVGRVELHFIDFEGHRYQASIPRLRETRSDSLHRPLITFPHKIILYVHIAAYHD